MPTKTGTHASVLKQTHYPLQALRVDVVKRPGIATIDVEHGNHLAVVQHRHHYLAARQVAASDMPGECMNVGHHDSALLAPCRAAHAATASDAKACQRTLKRTHHKFRATDNVKARPQKGELCMKRGSNSRHARNIVGFAGKHTLKLPEDKFITPSLIFCVKYSLISHSAKIRILQYPNNLFYKKVQRRIAKLAMG